MNDGSERDAGGGMAAAPCSSVSTAPGSGSIPLSALGPGEAGSVVRVGLEGAERRALLDLGFVPGTVVERLFQSPLGDPTAYRLRSTVVALRRTQAEAIEVLRCSR